MNRSYSEKSITIDQYKWMLSVAIAQMSFAEELFNSRQLAEYD